MADVLEMARLDRFACRFGNAIRAKLRAKWLAGKGGWDDPSWTREDMLRQLREHVEKGDMVDVAAFAMFLWARDTRSVEGMRASGVILDERGEGVASG